MGNSSSCLVGKSIWTFPAVNCECFFQLVDVVWWEMDGHHPEKVRCKWYGWMILTANDCNRRKASIATLDDITGGFFCMIRSCTRRNSRAKLGESQLWSFKALTYLDLDHSIHRVPSV